MNTGSLIARWGACVLLAIVAATESGLLASRPPVGALDSCATLTSVSLADAAITGSETVPADAPPFHATRAFCRVLMTMTPTSDSKIHVEIWMPIEGWNGKFQAVGNGDAAGVISYGAMREAVNRGFATSSTDTGHVGNSMAFALGHREQYIDFGYRSVHEMTIKAK